MASCTATNDMIGDPSWKGPPQPPVCQSGNDCCEPHELVCTGDPDKGTICRCFKSWDCESVLNPEKCAQKPGDTPDGKLNWSCKVEGGMEVCTRPGQKDIPSGKNGWSCFKGEHGNTVCQRPVHTPGGGTGWSCHYEEGVNKICVLKPPTVQQDQKVPGKKLDGGTPPPPPPKKDSGITPKQDQGPPPGTSGWKCYTDGKGVTVCKKGGAGMPSGGKGSWKCYWKGGKIVCEGSSPTPPGGQGWNCVPNPKVGGWRCEKNVGPDDMPPGKGGWGCASGSAMGGTVCTQNPNPPPPGSGQECVPNDKMWCDGAGYCGWGLVVCGPDGKWKTKFNPKTGKVELDCWEPASGIRPNTACACYFTYYNKACCEQPSCILPPGTNGQICPPSPGQYCDYCNALKPECKAPGAKCVVTGSHETFCGQDCIGGKPCPPNSMCMKFTLKSGTTWQCVPPDISCYF
jgi:hypothetical protein